MVVFTSGDITRCFSKSGIICAQYRAFYMETFHCSVHNRVRRPLLQNEGEIQPARKKMQIMSLGACLKSAQHLNLDE